MQKENPDFGQFIIIYIYITNITQILCYHGS